MASNDIDKHDRKIRELYRYDEMSNKVLKPDRSLDSNKSNPLKDAADSQPKSMIGKISVKEMGSLAKQDVSNVDREAYKQEAVGNKLEEKQPKRALNRSTMKSTLLGKGSVDKLNYYPSDELNSARYDGIVQHMATLLGDDLPHDIIISGVDFVLEVLKGRSPAENSSTKNQKILIENTLSMPVSEQWFHKLVNLAKDISDYGSPSQVRADTDDGVAILADEDDEDDNENDNALMNEVQDQEEEEELDQESALNMTAGNASLASGAALVETLDKEDVIIFSTGDGESGNMIEEVPIYEVDELFLLRKVSLEFQQQDSVEIQSLSDAVFALLAKHSDTSKLESELAKLIDLNHYSLIKFICRNRDSIYWGTKLAKAAFDQVPQILDKMRSLNLVNLISTYERRAATQKRQFSPEDHDTGHNSHGELKKPKLQDIPKTIDLRELAFDQGSELMTTDRVSLPADSFKRVKEGYEEIHIPPPSRPSENFDLVPISALPAWAKGAFPSNEMTSLNRIQSEVYPMAMGNDENMLICAPTGSGKTNIAMLSVLRVLSHHINKSKGGFDLQSFKIVYIAPLKALVQEQVREFQRRLVSYGIKVGELTGDSSLTRQQIADCTVLVSTPEKWDIVTRKATGNDYSSLVELLIIDEIHLLHDERGPVLESIVARSLRNISIKEKLRIVALSATLPNYSDVAKFLRAPQHNTFYFDSSFRPCPLAQQFCGITETAGIKKINAMNQACYDKLLEVVQQGHQAIVFVHSRKDTARTATWLKNKLLEEEKIQFFRKSEPGSREILRREAENASDKHLADLLTHGFGIHHAGLTKSDRSLSEDLFADGLLSVLVSTATLAWGVNLPAHAVIIKGTDVYSPEKGTWTRLSPQDVLQMLGRAGRPRYDTFGEGIIITQNSSIQYYLAMLNQQLPIESQLISRLADNLNSEIVLGNITSRKEAVDWLGYTYLYVRMLGSPELYGIQGNAASNDQALTSYRNMLAHSALQALNDSKLTLYDAVEGSVKPTELGRIASYFYIKHHSIASYNAMLNEHLTTIEVLQVFSNSDEFKYIPVREEERLELQRLVEKAPIPIQEAPENPHAKINVLLQSFISRSRLDGFALKSDMLYITQSAGRIMRALFELSLKRAWSRLSKNLLTLCKSIETKTWVTNSALRQFKTCPTEVIRHAEASFLPWKDYLQLSSPREVGELLRLEKHGKLVFDLLQKFPKLEIQCSVQPITPSVLQFQLEMKPSWNWDRKVHGFSESFLILLEDEMGEKLLYYDRFTVKEKHVNKEHFKDFTVFLNSSQQRNLPLNFFISLVSDKWMQSEVKVPVVLENVKLPKKFPAPTPLLDLEGVSISELCSDEFESAIGSVHFNKAQSQVFPVLYETNENVLIGLAPGNGRAVMAELALFNLWRQAGNRAVFICPSENKIEVLLQSWRGRFSGLAGGKSINKFTEDNLANLKLLGESHLILCTPSQFDLVSRKWKQRKNVQKIELLILDQAHLVGNGLPGAVYENIISRMTFISAQLETNLRIVALSNPVANSRDFGEWMGVKKENVFNFSPLDRGNTLQIQIQSTEQSSNHRYLTRKFIWSLFQELQFNVDNTRRLIVFTSSRKRCVETVIEILKTGAAQKFEPPVKGSRVFENPGGNPSSRMLLEAASWKIGCLHADMTNEERDKTKTLFANGQLNLLVVSREEMFQDLKATSVVLLGTSYYEGKEHRYVDYTMNQMQEMIKIASLSPSMNKALVFTSPKKNEYYKKFLSEPLPVESFMYYHLPDAISCEISTGVIESKQDCVDWLTYSLFYRRLYGNPSFYGVKDISPLGISAFLTEVVEDVVEDLVAYSIVEAEKTEDPEGVHSEGEEDIFIPLNGCLISAHHNVSTSSVKSFYRSLSKTSGLRSMLEAISSAGELEIVPVRENEAETLESLYQKVPVKSSRAEDFESPEMKVFILLQAHLSRIQLKNELKRDTKEILKVIPRLVSALVDFLAGEGNLNATVAMDLSQMLTQGMWDTDSPLLQIPFFDLQMVNKCNEKDVETIYDVMALEDEEREGLLKFDNDELNTIADFVNTYPNIELTYSIDLTKPLKAGRPFKVSVTLTRDEEAESLDVVAHRFPYSRKENWWIVAGEASNRELFCIKKVSQAAEVREYELEVTIHEQGRHVLTLWCVSDSYVDADKEVSIELDIE
ncbi:LAQU0S06e00716g1_1 [Lachancea quebecensis]|uniref:U5 small nuclear ribonucleoprotein 200 kDa helicase n=1 Tax=Lachancea quebecensis TaxID=1654605 RepID=A0A0P1KRG7_9SACH|nr:LAQU0S06e00716g1_1 [Lachancea quebecensis]